MRVMRGRTRKKFARRLFPAGRLWCMITCSKYLLARHVFIVMGHVKARWLTTSIGSVSLMIQRVALLKFLLLVKTSCEFKSSSENRINNFKQKFTIFSPSSVYVLQMCTEK
jgi:hypothetical protein